MRGCLLTTCVAAAAFAAVPTTSRQLAPLTHTAQAAASNRTEALVEWADKCAAVLPPSLDVQKDCFNLAIAGAGSRTIYQSAKQAGWSRAVHEHGFTVMKQLATSSPPRCFVVQLREPAARLESWYKDDCGSCSDSLDEYFEKIILGKNPSAIPSRNYPVNWYFRNYSGVETTVDGNGQRKVSPSDDYTDHSAVLWGALSFYKEHGDETQVPGIDVSHVHMDEKQAAPATVDAPLVDCEEKQIVIGFLCAETLVPSFEAFSSSAKAGEAITPPTGLQVGVNPVLNVSKYPLPTDKFMMSEANRRIWNDAFNFDDMALYRHFCLGEVDDALIQQNADAAGEGAIGSHHKDLNIPSA